MTKEKLSVVDESGNSRELEILFTYADEENNKEYVFVYEETNKDEVMVFELVNGEELYQVEDEELFKKLSEILDAFEEQRN